MMNSSVPEPRSPDAQGSPELVHRRGNGDFLQVGTDGLTLTTAHCTIVAADIVGFGQHDRNDIQVRIRHGMYEAMRAAFDTAYIPWQSCQHEDRGDGVLVLVPANVRKRLLADHLPTALVEALSLHNRAHPARERIRLRLALHAGEVNYDQHGVAGSAINHTFRLLDADVLRGSLKNSPAVLAVIGSAWFFDDVIRHGEASQAKTYRRVEVLNKETITEAWIRLLRPPVVRRVPDAQSM
ncbi:hypothetical protein [Lentzea sp. NPDC059081]|uniref:hypothetical protein n=1 Tax=Lentzea sp. NPDC059081 TaxID=3346719 RepID=UPI00369E8972